MGKRFSRILRIFSALFCILAFVLVLWCLCTGVILTSANYFVLLEIKCHSIAQMGEKNMP